MQKITKSILLSFIMTVRKLLQGTFMETLPSVKSVHNFLFWNLLPKQRIIEDQGSRMYMNPDNLPERFKETFKCHITSGGYEELTTELFKQVINEGDIVVDVGANIGHFTLLASRLVGKEGRVYAFEPETFNHSLLVRNIELNEYQNITVEQKAISNTTGTIKLFIDNENPGAHTIRRYSSKKEFIEVKSLTLDDYFKARERTINVIKMDIEGAETTALLGMERIIRENENLKIFTEFAPFFIIEMGYSAEEFARKLLEEWQFSIMAIDDHTKNKRCMRVNSVGGLMDFCEGSSLGYVNLFAEKAQFHKNATMCQNV
ncbi:FkbM family methyltransferase [Chloroflexota bacterium]